MLTFEELESDLAHFSYRPNWTLTLHKRDEGILLHIVAEVENSYDTSEPVVLYINTWLPPIPSHAYWTQYLYWRLKLIEIHECQEWFKRDGVPVYDPHAKIDPQPEEVNKTIARMNKLRGN